MTVEVAIVDDDNIHISMIKRHLKEFDKSSGILFHTSVFHCATDFLEDAMLPSFQLLILGVDLPDISGIDLLKQLEYIDTECITIITTNHKEFALEAYKCHVQAYLLKPVLQADFHSALNRIIPAVYAKSYLSKGTDALSIRRNGVDFQLPLSQVLYFEKYRNKVSIFTDTTCYQSYYTIRKLRNMLNQNQFVQIHQGCIVNWDYVTGLEGHYLIVGKHKLIISNSYFRSVLFHLQMHPIKTPQKP